ncbi:MAG: hypoxanthine phosphoribosyltransferase, partial [Fidelibacterota bacterium]
MADSERQEIKVPESSRYGGEALELFIPEEEIQAKVAELAAVISDRFHDRCPILIGVLNGSFMFMADFVRQLDIDFEVDFIKISSYGNETSSTGTVRLLKDISADITGRDVVIVEDIVDTGLTVKFLR